MELQITGKIMKNNDKKKTIQSIIWFNLFIGMYYLYIFGTTDSVFHLIIGSMNIGVWVFFRDSIVSLVSSSRK